jgi:hypothetical protein
MFLSYKKLNKDKDIILKKNYERILGKLWKDFHKCVKGANRSKWCPLRQLLNLEYYHNILLKIFPKKSFIFKNIIMLRFVFF